MYLITNLFRGFLLKVFLRLQFLILTVELQIYKEPQDLKKLDQKVGLILDVTSDLGCQKLLISLFCSFLQNLSK